MKKKFTIIILHGWGSAMSGKRYNELKGLLEAEGYTVYSPDFPGFGFNPLGKKALEFEDYVNFVKEFIQKKKLQNIVLLGHSFGGRVSIKFASEFPNKVQALILTGASGIPRALPGGKKQLVFLATKILRPLFVIPPFSLFFGFFRKLVYYSIGELDYYKAGNLSQTFKNVYQVSILADLPHVKVPTLLVWGREDKIIPVEDGKKMKRLIPRSKFVIVKNEGHKLPYENPKKFFDACLPFLKTL